MKMDGHFMLSVMRMIGLVDLDRDEGDLSMRNPALRDHALVKILHRARFSPRHRALQAPAELPGAAERAGEVHYAWTPNASRSIWASTRSMPAGVDKRSIGR